MGARSRIQSNEEVLQAAAAFGDLHLRLVLEVRLPRLDLPGMASETPEPPRPVSDFRAGDVFEGPLGTFRIRRIETDKQERVLIHYQFAPAKGGKVQNPTAMPGCFLKTIDGHRRVDPKPKPKPKTQAPGYRELNGRSILATVPSPGVAFQFLEYMEDAARKFRPVLKR